ncbi:hypothetical protein DPMN_064087 [Dreissena polymorpha]|uniref:Uncharacterized protein n=1 Tax=Dreissena polymorpha TaxID=45954 RepID=A0A9D4CCU0_DREPO|nr:hypothetical protein DPMN_064087 [Dreissena polymorpha]
MSRRKVVRRVEESAAILTDANLERHFTESEHVVKTIKLFQDTPLAHLKDIRGIIIKLIALYNAS